jgi:hypothetical protein
LIQDIYTFCKEHIKLKYDVEDIEKIGKYGKGIAVVNSLFLLTIKKMVQLEHLNFVFIAYDKTREESKGVDTSQIVTVRTSSLSKTVHDILSGDMDITAFAHTIKIADNKGVLKNYYVLNPELGNPAMSTGNRFGIDEIFEMSYESMIESIEESRNKIKNKNI